MSVETKSPGAKIAMWAVVAWAVLLLWLPSMLLLSLVEAWILCPCWNRSVVEAFAWPPVNYWQCWFAMMGLNVLFAPILTLAKTVSEKQ